MKITRTALILFSLFLPDIQSAETKPSANDERYLVAVEQIRRGDLPAIKALLTDRSVLDLRNEAGTPLVMYAALYLNAEGLEPFLTAGADPNATNRTGASALLWAATDLAKVRALLRHGA